MHLAVEGATALQFDTVQIFTKSQKQWASKPLADDVVASWRGGVSDAKFSHTVAHDSYLINLASPSSEQREKSMQAFAEELRRCDLLGIPYLVSHPGAHLGEGEEVGVKRVAQSLDRVHAMVKRAKVMTCLEATAGQGTCLGHRLEHLAEIMNRVKHPERLGVCLDTAHLFAAGYDFRGRKFAKFMREVEATVGLKNVRVLHLNDSKKELGSRVDRHEHIGLGFIGLEGFKGFAREKAFRTIPKIFETPKGPADDKRDWDTVNLEVLKSLE